MVSNEEILKALKNQDTRIKKLEKLLKQSKSSEEINVNVPVKEKRINIQKKTTNKTKLSFTQIITFLGVIGIVIGVVSFFFYAVARNWIGETGQVMIGILLGFFLFAFAFILHKKSESWSNIVFGGSFFIEYIAISVGVLLYKIMPDYVGIILAVVFLLSSTFLSIRFKSRVIAYFTLVGGFLIPFITGSYQYDLFILIFYTILSFGLVALSFKENWADLRFTSFVILAIILLSYINKFSNAPNKFIPLTFLIVLFMLHHLSAVINSIKNPKNNLPVLDSIIIVAFTIVFLTILYSMFDWSKLVYGIFVMLFSMIFLLEIFYFNATKTNTSPSVAYSLLGTGIVTLNLGFFFLTEIIDYQYLIVVFAIEYVIFSIISKESTEKKLYFIFSIISLIIVFIIYTTINLKEESMLKSTIMILVYLAIVLSFIFLSRKDINFKLNAAAFLIGGFFYIYSFTNYLLRFKIPIELDQIVLSILWLIYTLVFFKQVETKQGKLLVGVLLGITLIKIALRDLFYLRGIYRIIGFIIFGILLLIGGYLLNRHEKK